MANSLRALRAAMIIPMSRNEPSLHSRCPRCQTVFRVTVTQIKARHGMVRCGRCQHAFQADQHVVRKPVASAVSRQTKELVKAALAPARKRATPRKIPVAEPAPATAPRLGAPFPPAGSLRQMPAAVISAPPANTKATGTEIQNASLW